MTRRESTTAENLAARRGITARWRVFAAGALLAACVITARPAAAQVVLFVNGLPITAIDIDQRMKLEKLSSPKPVTRDEAIKLLIDDKLKITIAKRYGMELTESEINASFAQIASRVRQTPDQFAQSLTRSGVSPGALKSRISADMIWQQLVRGKFGASLQVSEGELANAMQSNKASEQDETGFIYTLRPVIVVVPRGSNDVTVDGKRREAEALRSRFLNCNEGIAMARGLRDVAVRDPVRRSSADVSAGLREILSKLEVGRLTAPEVTAQGLEMFALCDKKATKTETPEKREMKEKIFSQRFDKEAKKFLEETRRSAIIEYR